MQLPVKWLDYKLTYHQTSMLTANGNNSSILLFIYRIYLFTMRAEILKKNRLPIFLIWLIILIHCILYRMQRYHCQVDFIDFGLVVCIVPCPYCQRFVIRMITILNQERDSEFQSISIINHEFTWGCEIELHDKLWWLQCYCVPQVQNDVYIMGSKHESAFHITGPLWKRIY